MNLNIPHHQYKSSTQYQSKSSHYLSPESRQQQLTSAMTMTTQRDNDDSLRLSPSIMTRTSPIYQTQSQMTQNHFTQNRQSSSSGYTSISQYCTRQPPQPQPQPQVENAQADHDEQLTSLLSMPSSLCSTNQVMDSLKFSSKKSTTINQHEKPIQQELTCKNDIKQTRQEVSSPQTKLNQDLVMIIQNASQLQTYQDEDINYIQSDQATTAQTLKSPTNQSSNNLSKRKFSFNKVLKEKMQEKLQSQLQSPQSRSNLKRQNELMNFSNTKTNITQSSNNLSKLTTSNGKLKKSQQKIPKYDYSEEKSKRELEHTFLKTYSQVNIPKENPQFHERMDFDIFKRNSKAQRLNLILQQSGKKQKSLKRDELFDRLVQDGKRRDQFKVMRQQQKEQQIVNTCKGSIQAKQNNAPLSPQKSDQIYQRFQENEKQRQQRIHEKKRLYEVEKQISSLRRNQNAHQTIKHTDVVNKLIQDTERRKNERDVLDFVKDLATQLAVLDSKKKRNDPTNSNIKTKQSSQQNLKHRLPHLFIENTDENMKNVDNKTIAQVSEFDKNLINEYYGKILNQDNVQALDLWKEYLKNDCSGQIKKNDISCMTKNNTQLQESSITIFNTLRPSQDFLRESPNFNPQSMAAILKQVGYNLQKKSSKELQHEIDSLTLTSNQNYSQQKLQNQTAYDDSLGCDLESSIDDSHFNYLSERASQNINPHLNSIVLNEYMSISKSSKKLKQVSRNQKVGQGTYEPLSKRMSNSKKQKQTQFQNNFVTFNTQENTNATNEAIDEMY
eukprot:403368750